MTWKTCWGCGNKPDSALFPVCPGSLIAMTGFSPASLPCGIALGSNLGDRAAHLAQAVSALESAFGQVLCSPVYETVPQGCPAGSPPYLNAVAEVQCDWRPLTLLAFCHGLEQRAGRMRTGIYGAPRTLDADILYMGSLALDLPGLVLPHPRAHIRRFVLKPLADIRPKLVLPGQNDTVAALLAALDSAEPAPILFSQS